MNHKIIASYLINQISNPLGKIALTFAACICSTLPAQAASFNFTYSPGTTESQKSAVEMAGQVWSNYIEDDITVNLHMEMTDANQLPTNTIGGALPAFLSDADYGDFYNNLVGDRRSADDVTATDTLLSEATSNTFSDGTFNKWGIFSGGQVDRWTSNGGDAQGRFGSDKINLTTANAKAVGLIDQHDTALDGVILLSDLSTHNVDWQYDYLSFDVANNKLDFTSVVIHEIGHVLGFVSALDAINSDNHSNEDASTGDTTDKDNRQKHFTSLDLFRYLEPKTLEVSNWSMLDGSFVETTEEVITTQKALSYGQESIFSIDGGFTSLANFSTGQDTTIGDSVVTIKDGTLSDLNYYGDGFQGSHWQHQNPVIGIMDPLLPVNERRSITELDVKALDVIGYDIKGTQTSLSNLQSQANTIAANKGSILRHSDIEDMFNQFRWGGASSGGTFQIDTDLTDFLAQKGFLQKGTFWSHMPTEVASVPEPTSMMGLLGFGLLSLGLRRKKFN